MRRYRTATHWGIYEVEVENDEVVNVLSINEDPVPSSAMHALKEAASHSSRIDQPYVRKGWLDNPRTRGRTKRGSDEFVAVSWDDAFELASDELSRVIDELGNTSIFGGSYGWASAGRFHHAQSQLHRFLNLIGGCTRARESYSTAAAQVILPHVVASWQEMELAQTSWSEIAANGDLFVAFGGVPLRNTQMAYGGIAGLDGRKAYGIGSFFQDVKDKFVDDIIPNEIKENPMLATLGGGALLNQFGMPDWVPGVGGMGENWLGDLLGAAIPGDTQFNTVLGDTLPFMYNETLSNNPEFTKT